MTREHAQPKLQAQNMIRKRSRKKRLSWKEEVEGVPFSLLKKFLKIITRITNFIFQ
jgi:hypothetical protein